MKATVTVEFTHIYTAECEDKDRPDLVAGLQKQNIPEIPGLEHRMSRLAVMDMHSGAVYNLTKNTAAENQIVIGGNHRDRDESKITSETTREDL